MPIGMHILFKKNCVLDFVQLIVLVNLSFPCSLTQVRNLVVFPALNSSGTASMLIH